MAVGGQTPPERGRQVAGPGGRERLGAVPQLRVEPGGRVLRRVPPRRTPTQRLRRRLNPSHGVLAAAFTALTASIAFAGTQDAELISTAHALGLLANAVWVAAWLGAAALVGWRLDPLASMTLAPLAVAAVAIGRSIEHSRAENLLAANCISIFAIAEFVVFLGIGARLVQHGIRSRR